MSATGIGAAVRRKEDQRVITGKGNYTADVNRPGQGHAYFLRSPHAHAKIRSIDGKAVKACTVFAWQLEGANVLTIEGLADPNGPLHPMQEAFREHHGLQCGYCTPGMIMTAVDIVHRKGHDLSDHTIREELEGNLCRCTGYQNIVQSIAAGAKAMANSDLA